MTIVRWDPFRDLFRDESHWPFEKEGAVAWKPKLDIKETDDHIIASMDIPGMKMEDINVSIDKNRVSISGERKVEKEEKGEDFIKMERTFGSFCRSFYLGIPVKEEGAKASYNNGVLEVSLPKVKAKKAKKIKVEGKK
ncbi:MAG: Hsp20/alpha crystallin family protein [Actinomycetota bacterium]